MMDAPDASQFLTTAGAARTAVYEVRHDDAVTGGFLSRFRVHDHEAAMVGSYSERHPCAEFIIFTE